VAQVEMRSSATQQTREREESHDSHGPEAPGGGNTRSSEEQGGENGHGVWIRQRHPQAERRADEYPERKRQDQHE
jgi:hypothetical protein